MAINNDLLKAAIAQISKIEYFRISPDALVEEVVMLAKSYPDEERFSYAVASTIRALNQLNGKLVKGAALSGSLDGWMSYHYQLKRSQGEPANLRIIYRQCDDSLEVIGFGHRYRPIDLYHRIVLGI